MYCHTLDYVACQLGTCGTLSFRIDFSKIEIFAQNTHHQKVCGPPLLSLGYSVVPTFNFDQNF